MTPGTFEAQCPYCGEMIELEFELLDQPQSLIQDCTVCCRPIQVNVYPGEDEPDVAVERSE